MTNNDFVRMALNGHYTPMNTQAAADSYVNAGFGYEPKSAKEDMLVYFDTKNAPMRKSKEVNDELIAERLANRPHPISELNRMELQREDEEQADDSLPLSFADSPWNDPRMALAKYEYVWHGNLEPMKAIFTEYESRRKESAMKEEQQRQKDLIEMNEKQSDKKRLEEQYDSQMDEVIYAEKLYEQALRGTSDKEKADAKIALEREISKLNRIGKKLKYAIYGYTPVEETRNDEPTTKETSDMFSFFNDATGTSYNTVNQIKTYIDNMKTWNDNAENRSKKDAIAKALTKMIDTATDGDLKNDLVAAESSLKNIKLKKPIRIYKVGEEVAHKGRPPFKIEQGAYWDMVGVDRWRVVK